MKSIMIAIGVKEVESYDLILALNNNFGGTGRFTWDDNNQIDWHPREEHVLNEKFETRIFWFTKGWLRRDFD